MDPGPGVFGPPLHAPGAGRMPARAVGQALERYGSVVVWGRTPDWLPLDRDGAIVPGPLGDRDRQRLLALRHPAVRARLVASRALLRTALSVPLGVPPDQVALTTEPGGRPVVAGHPRLGVSLSHTGNMLLAGICANGRIGVDVERLDRPLAVDTLARYACDAGEQAMLARADPAERAGLLLRLWTLKEACAKAAGEGLRLRFAELGFAPGQDGPGFDGGTECEEITGPAPRSGRWGFAYCSPTPGYTFAFARCLH